jgi:FtsZ-interacting cell division protein ZipA
MSTITPTPETDQAAQDHIPVAVWRIYKQKRTMFREKQRIATWMALDECGYTSQRSRERLGDLLVKRENEQGFGSTPEEEEQEIALEAAEAEAGGPVVAAEPEPGSLGAIQADARERLETLREQRVRLAPEALTDAAAKAEMLNLEAEIAAAETALDLVEVARGETGRREREATEQAEREHREAENAAALKMVPAVAKQKGVVDAVLASAAAEVVKLEEVQDRQGAHYVAGGMDAFSARGVRFRADEVESAVRFHLRAAGLFSRVTGRDQPLVEVKQ